MDTIERMQELLTECLADIRTQVISQLPRKRGMPDWGFVTWKQRTLVERAFKAVPVACQRAAAAMTDPERDFGAAVRDHARVSEVWQIAWDIINLACRSGVPEPRLPDKPAKPYRPPLVYPHRQGLTSSPAQRLEERAHDCHFCGAFGRCDC